MENHVRNSHTDEPAPRFPCDQCAIKCKSETALELHKKTHVPRPRCECGVQCRSEERLERHKQVCNYQPESAIPSDYRRTIRTDRFLGKRKNRAKQSGNALIAGSSASALSDHFQSLKQEFQPELKAYLDNMNSTLKTLQEGMAGLTSAIVQK